MPKFARWSLLAVLFFMLASGCVTSEPAGASSEEFKRTGVAAPAPNVAKLAAGDSIELSVEVDGQMEVSMHRASVNHQGFATLPLIGDVRVGGLSVEEARSAIAKVYGRYYVRPPVIMIARVDVPDDGGFGFVTLTGKINQPGLVQIKNARGIRLTAAVQTAGGFAPSAKKNEIRISRVAPDGKKMQIVTDYTAIGKEGNADADVLLTDGDIVYVPERLW